MERKERKKKKKEELTHAFVWVRMWTEDSSRWLLLLAVSYHPEKQRERKVENVSKGRGSRAVWPYWDFG